MRKSNVRAGRSNLVRAGKRTGPHAAAALAMEALEPRSMLAADLGAVAERAGDGMLQDAPPAPSAAIGSTVPSRTITWEGRRLHAVPGEFVFQSTANPADRLPAGWQVRGLGTGSWLLSAGQATEAEVKAWSTTVSAVNFEPNYILRPLGTPVDPEYPNQWHLPRINAPSAWDVTNGSASVVVAILDSGIDYNHPDFSTDGTTDRKNIWVNTDEIPNNGLDDDRNGRVDDYYGYDFGANDPDPMDDDPNPIDREDANIAELGTNGPPNKYTGHGTAVAGVMGAVAGTTTPQRQVAGVNWDLDMMALKITRPGVGYVLSAAVEAYKYIQLMRSQFKVNIVIANCSWGTYEDNVQIRNLEAEIEKAGGQDVLTVAAAGDSGISIDSTPFYPAAFPSDYVLSVAATNRNDSLWVGSPDFDWRDNRSNFGVRNVDVAAPGKEILTTISRHAAGGSAPGGTGNWEGTSMAAGIVSGVAALMKAVAPTAPALALKQIIINTVNKVPQLNGRILSGGIVNAGAAVAEVLLPLEPQIDIRHLPGQEIGVREGHLGFTTATWQIRVRGPLLDPRVLYVDYRTVDTDGSATPDGRRDPRTLTDQEKKSDYVPVIGTMTFMPGPRVVDRLTQVGRTAVDVGRIRSIPVRIFGDRDVEEDETMRLRIDRAYYRNADGTIQLVNNFILTRTNDFTIINDDVGAPDGSDPGARTPTITFVGNTPTGGVGTTSSTVEVREGDAGTSVARFPLRLSIPTTNTVTVRYTTRDLQARAGVDYVARSGMVTFRPNVTQQFIDIPVIGNRVADGNRSFQVVLTDPTNAVLPATGPTTSGNTATGVILDDDPVIRVPGLAAGAAFGTATASEGSRFMTINLTLSNPRTTRVTVRYATQDLNAIAGRDYVRSSGTVVFAPGATTATINIPLINDSAAEGSEAFLVLLSQPTNAGLIASSVRCTITDDDQVAAPVSTPLALAFASFGDDSSPTRRARSAAPVTRAR